MTSPAYPVSELSAEHRQHVARITQARHDPFGDAHGGGLGQAVEVAHKAGVSHPVIAHYSGMSVERVGRLAAIAKAADPFELGKKLTDPNGNVFQRPQHRNTRRQNAAVGATLAGGMLGIPGAALGAKAGKNRAKSGVQLLHSVGVGPSRARGAAIVARHATREAGKAGAVLGGVGAAYGTLVGASAAHRKDNKKLPVGRVVQKNDRHMDPAPSEYRMSGAVPRHSAAARTVAEAAKARRTPPVAAAIRGTLRATTIGKSAFEPAGAVEKKQEEVEKKKVGAVLTGRRLPPRGFEPRKLPAAAVRDGSGRGAQGQRRVVHSGRV